MKIKLCLLLALAFTAIPQPDAAAKPRDKDAPVSPEKLSRIREANVRKAREKMGADSKQYRQDEYAELESLYQKGNANPRTPENQVFLKEVVEKFPKSNRAGCAALYLGRYTQGDEQEKYLKLAIEKYSDSYYGDGTCVGGFARFVMGMIEQKAGKQSAAKKRFEEIRKDYEDSTDHGGRLLVESLPK